MKFSYVVAKRENRGYYTLFAGFTFSLNQAGLLGRSIGTNLIFSCRPYNPSIKKKIRQSCFKKFHINHIQQKEQIKKKKKKKKNKKKQAP